MANHLTAFLLHALGAEWPRAGEPIAVRVDHVLLDGRVGTVACLAFEALRAERVACELALVVPGRAPAGPDEEDDLRYLLEASASMGAPCTPPGDETAAALHRRGFAEPGRVLASAVPDASAAGALGMLVLPAGALECAAAMAGEPLRRPRPRVIGVQLEGDASRAVPGAAVARVVRDALGGALSGQVLEFHGPALGALGVPARVEVARALTMEGGALAVLFPSDERAREWLREHGRDGAWRRLEGGATGFDATCTVSLDRLEQETPELAAPPEEFATPVAVAAVPPVAVEHGPHHRRPLAPSPFLGPERAEVLLDAGDRADAARILPWGPRAHALRADGPALAEGLFRAHAPGAAGRGRALGRSVVVAGGGYGAGVQAEDAARATAALGVRAVIAERFAPEHERQLALHGVLPLCWLDLRDHEAVVAGDEIELSGLPEALVPGGRVPVRHLTRGTAFAVRVGLDAPLLDIVREGGLLRQAARAGGS